MNRAEGGSEQASIRMDVTAVWYRAQAAECAERAEKATDQNIKAINTDMAEAWLRLAELVEQLDARDSS